jgi:hypothetical protein
VPDAHIVLSDQAFEQSQGNKWHIPLDGMSNQYHIFITDPRVKDQAEQ